MEPAEVRWLGEGARVAYIGGGRWRLDARTMSSLRELADSIAKSVVAAPGRVEFVAPGVHDVIEVARRDDLVGVLPRNLVPLDVTSPTREPFIAYAARWLDWNSERCWPDDVARPADRFGDELSAAAFASSSDPAALASDLDRALAARVSAATAPENVVETAIRELAALGHTSTFADSDGRWSVWASQWVIISFEPPRTCSVSPVKRIRA